MQYLIYGSKDFAIILRGFLEYHQMPFAGFIDDFSTGDGIIGSFSDVTLKYNPDEYEIVLGVGYTNLEARLQIFNKIKSAGFTIATLIHEKAYVRSPANIGEGSIVMAQACVDCNAVLEDVTVLWPGVVVNHDSRVGRNSFLSPNSTICGFVTIGENTFVGAGAVIVDHLEIPPGSFVKAGSLYAGKESGSCQPLDLPERAD
jgi:sugar O-acyltransferase (sialic acid O-acetyltransferase NeuD family)